MNVEFFKDAFRNPIKTYLFDSPDGEDAFLKVSGTARTSVIPGKFDDLQPLKSTVFEKCMHFFLSTFSCCNGFCDILQPEVEQKLCGSPFHSLQSVRMHKYGKRLKVFFL